MDLAWNSSVENSPGLTQRVHASVKLDEFKCISHEWKNMALFFWPYTWTRIYDTQQ